ncbi:MAG: hypothetical protein AAF639_16025 [Chloroflexota bacterium]
MANTKSETFGDYDLARALDFLGLFPHVKWDIDAPAIPASENLKDNLKRAERQVTIGSNEWEQRLFMELIFLEALENHDLRMWQEKQVDAGKAPFRGKADFVFTQYQVSFKLPYIILCEAKKDDFEQGWGQCLMAAKASHMLNLQQGHNFDVHGIVSSGRVWEFGKYTTNNQFYKTDSYSILQLDTLLGVLDQIFTDCEANV